MLTKMNDNVNIVTKAPPDGGYGWVIAFANGLSNFITVPLMHCFGLIFKDTFTEMGLTATQGSVIINLNAAFGLLTGLMNGLLLKFYGYRKVAILAAFLLTSGVVLTSFSTTFLHFILSYGLIVSLGMGMNRSAYGLALISYFEENRNKAMSFAVTFTGFGPVIIPLLISFLMKFYSAQGVALIIAALCSHSFIAAVLLQPVKWHMVERNVEVTEECSDLRDNSTYEEELEGEELQVISTVYESSPVNMGNEETNYNLISTTRGSPLKSPSLLQRSEKNYLRKNRKKSAWKRTLLAGARIFDLDLLKDPVFDNIILGLGLAIFAELNFSTLTPFILNDFGLNTDQIATFLSTLGVTDILFRFFAPYIGEYFKQPPRLMYMFSLLLLIITRSSLLISRNFYILLFMALGLGFAKGIRKVYMGLVVPSYVSLEKLPSASGMEMMVNGTCILVGGPLLGIVRDVTGSYTLCIVIMNCVTFTTIVLWTFELIFVKYRKRKALLSRRIHS